MNENKIIPYQYEFFAPPAWEDQVMTMLTEMRESQNKVRKGVYARLGDVIKDCHEIRHELETIKRDMCKYQSPNKIS